MKIVRLILSFAFCLCKIIVIAQDQDTRAQSNNYDHYIWEAYECIKNGDCVCAEQFYSVYKQLTNKTDWNLEQQILDCKSPKYLNFVTFNIAYSVAPQWSFGGCYGRISRKSRWGWFAGIVTNFSFKGYSTDKECDADGYLKDGSRPIYSGKTYRDRLSFIGGGVYRVADPLFIKAGLGYGVRNLCWEADNGTCYRNLGYSTAGVDVSLGVQLHLNRFVVSGDLVSTNFKTVEGKVGIGLTFYNNVVQ